MVSHAIQEQYIYEYRVSNDGATQFIPNMFTCRGVADLLGSTI